MERTTKWEREQAEFVRTIIQPALRGKRLAATWPALAPRVLALIDQVARQVPAGTRAADGFSPDMDPIAYERYCAARLRACGWDAHATPPGGDQGRMSLPCMAMSGWSCSASVPQRRGQ